MTGWRVTTDVADLTVWERTSADKTTTLRVSWHTSSDRYYLEIQRPLLREKPRTDIIFHSKDAAFNRIGDMLLDLPQPCWTFGQLQGTAQNLRGVLGPLWQHVQDGTFDFDLLPDLSSLRNCNALHLRHTGTLQQVMLEAREFPADATWDDFAKVVQAAVTDMLAEAAEEEE